MQELWFTMHDQTFRDASTVTLPLLACFWLQEPVLLQGISSLSCSSFGTLTVITLSIVTLIVMIKDNYTQVWRDSSSHGSSCRPFVHCESSSRGWRSSSPTLSLSSTSSSSSLSLLSTLPPTWSSVKYHHITGLVEEDTISRQSSCPSPTMIGALHGRDVVLRSATFDVINDNSTMASSYTMSWLVRYIEGMLFFYLKILTRNLLAKGGQVDRSFIK